ncbi:MAG: MarR family winged helix-turn-helix transcriptional regulator [Bacilli bacterium]
MTDKQPISESLAFIVSIAQKSLVQRMEQRFAQDGLPLTFEQFTVLSILFYEADLCQLELAQKSGRDQAAMSRLVLTLLKNGYVVKVPSTSDKRYNLISLTPEGNAARLKAIVHVEAVLAEATALLSDAEVEQGVHFLKHIIRTVGNTPLYSDTRCPLSEALKD